jgi:transmembrane sensor
VTQPAMVSLQRDAIEEEAARLFHAAREANTPDAWNAAYRWVELSPAHGVAFAKIEAGWEKASVLRLADNGDVAAETELETEAEAETPRYSRRRFAAMAAGLGVAMAGGAGLWRMRGDDMIATAVGEARSVHLADGSKVHLNTDSAIAVRMAKDIRSVQFIRGEARFDVREEAARPFLVSLGDDAVRTHGSKFNLRQRKDFTELTALSGDIAVVGASPARVPAGASAMIRTAAVVVVSLTPAELDRRSAWERGMIPLNGETLAQAVEEFNRYRGQPLVIGDPELAALRMGGTFSALHSDDFVDALKASFGIRAVEGKDGAIILLPGRQQTLEHFSGNAPSAPMA